MTDQDRELMQQALGYMESVGQMDMYPEEWAIAVALRERLAQPQRTHWEGCEEVHPECRQPEQEPVAWLVQYSNKHEFVWGQKPQWIADAIGIEPLYTTPQPRTWVGLTDEELEAVDKTIDKFVPLPEAKRLYARAIEAKLREKNA